MWPLNRNKQRKTVAQERREAERKAPKEGSSTLGAPIPGIKSIQACNGSLMVAQTMMEVFNGARTRAFYGQDAMPAKNI